jgi:hypothetical protein
MNLHDSTRYLATKFPNVTIVLSNFVYDVTRELPCILADKAFYIIGHIPLSSSNFLKLHAKDINGFSLPSFDQRFLIYNNKRGVSRGVSSYLSLIHPILQGFSPTTLEVVHMLSKPLGRF